MSMKTAELKDLPIFKRSRDLASAVKDGVIIPQLAELKRARAHLESERDKLVAKEQAKRAVGTPPESPVKPQDAPDAGPGPTER